MNTFDSQQMYFAFVAAIFSPQEHSHSGLNMQFSEDDFQQEPDESNISTAFLDYISKQQEIRRKALTQAIIDKVSHLG